MGKKIKKYLAILMIACVAAVIWGFVKEEWASSQYESQGLAAFVAILDTDKVANIEYVYDYEKERMLRYSIDGHKYSVKYPSMYLSFNSNIYETLAKYDVPISSKSSFGSQFATIASLIPSILMLVLVLILFKSISPMFSEDISVGMTDSEKTTFADIAGYAKVKDELGDLVNMLKNPDVYQKFHTSLPKGVLLSGPPGNGKTMCARAIAGESATPFFHISASQIENKFVGSGSRRLEKILSDVKKHSKKHGRAILFIDEIDAIGVSREKRTVVESNQTLNTLLTAMDGFEKDDQIIFVAATNLVDTLDPALTRSGRFDKHIHIPQPSFKDRKEILTLYLAENKEMYTLDVFDTDYLDTLASQTEGKCCADLKQIIQEAGSIAFRQSKEKIDTSCLRESLIRQTAGLEGDTELSPEDLRLVAYHEAGHVTVQAIVDPKGYKSIAYVTITPYGQSLGHMAINMSNMDLARRSDLENKVKVLFGGRIVEEHINGGDYTVGAASDLQEANKILLAYVGKYGMSESMPNLFLNKVDEHNLAVQTEVKHLRDRLYQEAKGLVEDHFDVVEAVAQKLITDTYIDQPTLHTVLESTTFKTKKDAVSI